MATERIMLSTVALQFIGLRLNCRGNGSGSILRVGSPVPLAGFFTLSLQQFACASTLSVTSMTLLLSCLRVGSLGTNSDSGNTVTDPIPHTAISRHETAVGAGLIASSKSVFLHTLYDHQCGRTTIVLGQRVLAKNCQIWSLVSIARGLAAAADFLLVMKSVSVLISNALQLEWTCPLRNSSDLMILTTRTYCSCDRQ